MSCFQTRLVVDDPTCQSDGMYFIYTPITLQNYHLGSNLDHSGHSDGVIIPGNAGPTFLPQYTALLAEYIGASVVT